MTAKQKATLEIIQIMERFTNDVYDEFVKGHKLLPEEENGAELLKKYTLSQIEIGKNMAKGGEKNE